MKKAAVLSVTLQVFALSGGPYEVDPVKKEGGADIADQLVHDEQEEEHTVVQA